MDNSGFPAIVVAKSLPAGGPSQVTSRPTICHVRTERRTRPSLRDPRAGRMARTDRIQLPTQRERVSARLPGGGAPRDGDAAPLRGLLRGRAQPRGRAAGLSADAGALSEIG